MKSGAKANLAVLQASNQFISQMVSRQSVTRTLSATSLAKTTTVRADLLKRTFKQRARAMDTTASPVRCCQSSTKAAVHDTFSVHIRTFLAAVAWRLPAD